MKQKLWILQKLCPQRHCIMGAAYEFPAESHEHALEALKLALEKLNVNPWCGICYSRDLKFEARETRFESMKEAAPVMTELLLGNLVAMEALQHRPSRS